jgi:hypothetical protein
MPPIASTIITMASPTITIQKISSPIYGSSSLIFLNDSKSFTTVDINLAKVTTIRSWC